MLIALLADIHANREAMSACLADAENATVDRYVILGDLVGYGADPGWVVDRVAEMAEAGAVVLRVTVSASGLAGLQMQPRENRAGLGNLLQVLERQLEDGTRGDEHHAEVHGRRRDAEAQPDQQEPWARPEPSVRDVAHREPDGHAREQHRPQIDELRGLTPRRPIFGRSHVNRNTITRLRG